MSKKETNWPPWHPKYKGKYPNQVRPEPPPAPPAKRANGVLMKVSYSNCQIYCSDPMECPLCHVVIPEMTHHRCSK
jgi:hypothetical protein